MTSSDWAAWASAFAAFCSLGVAIYVVRYQGELEDRRSQRENRLHIKKIIHELGDATNQLYAVTQEMVLINDPRAAMESLAARAKEQTPALEKARDSLDRFDDVGADRVGGLIRETYLFIGKLERLHGYTKAVKTDDTKKDVAQIVERSKGRLQAALVAAGPHLVRYGAEQRPWHGNNEDEE